MGATKFSEHLTFAKLFQAFICFWPFFSIISHRILIRLILQYCHVQLSKNNCFANDVSFLWILLNDDLSCSLKSVYLPSLNTVYQQIRRQYFLFVMFFRIWVYTCEMCFRFFLAHCLLKTKPIKMCRVITIF